MQKNKNQQDDSKRVKEDSLKNKRKALCFGEGIGWIAGIKKTILLFKIMSQTLANSWANLKTQLYNKVTKTKRKSQLSILTDWTVPLMYKYTEKTTGFAELTTYF